MENPQGNYRHNTSFHAPGLGFVFLPQTYPNPGRLLPPKLKKATMGPQGPEHGPQLMSLYATSIQNLQGNQEPERVEQQHFFEH